MKCNKKIVTAEFLKRPNRFQAYVKLYDEEIMVHVPNTGRCKEILVPEAKVILREENNPNRKTKYDLIAAYKKDKLINIDSQIPNKVVYEALTKNKIKSLNKYNIIEREKVFGNSRFDFKLSNDENEEYFLEVKGCTYEDNGHCMFPDAPTERGRKHLLELLQVKKTGRGAGVLFLIQIENIKTFSPYDEIDKAFGDALRKVYKKGVDVFCYNSKLGEDYIDINEKVELIL